MLDAVDVHRSSLDDMIRVRGARERNLQNVDVEIPRNAIVAFVGVSGSGKSALALGVMHAEAERRFLESIAPYARRLFRQTPAPLVDRLDAMPPSVALRQSHATPSARSTVASMSGAGNVLRLLYSRSGQHPPGSAPLEAEDFSSNTPSGACETCHGLGHVFDATASSMVPDDSLTIRQRAVAA